MAVRVVVIGSSGQAGVVLDALERCGGFEVVGLLDTFRAAGESAFGYPILGKEEAIAELVGERGVSACVVGVGDNYQRMRLRDRVRELAPALAFPSVVHPHACVSPRAKVGAGALLLAGAIVGPGAEVGEGCLLNTAASLDHDCVMEPFASLAPGAITGGNVRIGTCTAIGLGASILHGVSIGAHSVVGAGATVVKDVPERCVAFGVPARMIRARVPGETYL